MTSVSHETGIARPDQPGWLEALKITEMWAALAISVMWLAVLFDAVYGPDFVSSSGASTTTIPSSIVVALFAFLGTASVAKHAFGHEHEKR